MTTATSVWRWVEKNRWRQLPSARPGLRRRFTNRIEAAAQCCAYADRGCGNGLYESNGFPGRYPCLQILTIAELLAGKKLEYPAHRVETFAKAEQKIKSEQDSLF